MAAGLPLLGVTLPQFSERPGPAVEACLDARGLGFGGGFVFDHLWPLGQPSRPALEGWTLLAALAAEVGRRPEGPG
jgi:alkanesulfonate monooxygenase SsuD/methylene tetrahydromethanopterin reductase-like flavin-dependent oxidoreductase (luciferase family)